MPLLLTYLLSLSWTYVEDQTIKGWFANDGGKPRYSVYYDKQAKALAIIHWSGNPAETVPLGWILDEKGFRIQKQELRQLDPLREIQQ